MHYHQNTKEMGKTNLFNSKKLQEAVCTRTGVNKHTFYSQLRGFLNTGAIDPRMDELAKQALKDELQKASEMATELASKI